MATELLREAVRRFIDTEVRPFHDEWETQGFTPRELWRKAGHAGFLCPDVPECYGGIGVEDWSYNAVIIEEIARSHCVGADFATHSEMVTPYVTRYGTEEQKRRWLPGMVNGDFMGALALTEPGAGSDLAGIRTKAERTPDGYRLNGQKTFINNGHIHDFSIVAAKTRQDIPSAISLFLVERSRPGYSTGPIMKKLGLHSQDMTEIFLDDVLVPHENLIGRADAGFGYIIETMRRERLVIAVQAAFMAETTLRNTVEYTKSRLLKGEPLAKLQNTRFVLARLLGKLELAKHFAVGCYGKVLNRRLTDFESALAKWWATEVSFDVAHECLQLHGGFGYMQETGIAKAFANSRGALIYGGASEVMFEIMAKEIRL